MNIADWINEDKTFCSVDCEMKDCERNQKHIKDKTIPHSYSDFRGTENCLKTTDKPDKE